MAIRSHCHGDKASEGARVLAAPGQHQHRDERDCIVLFRRLLADERVPRRHKLLLGALIPVAGQLDDAIIVAVVLRTVLRAGGPELLREHWPGPASSLNVLTRLAYGKRTPTAPS